jgi:ABC-type multidrug transport system fused ATPase/permease subunit
LLTHSLAAHSLESDANTLPWIAHVTDFAQSGILQVVVLGISLVWTIAGLLRRGKRSGPKSHDKASSVRWPYEACSQIARIVSLVFVILAYVQREIHLLNVVLVAYAFVMGVTRLRNDLRWRHLALHQVNFTMTAILIVLAVAQCLPCIQSGAQCAKETSVIVGILALGVALVVALVTPREWIPPQIHYDIPGWKEPEHPAPEETCSWLNYYFTYEWLTPIIWKGTRRRLDMSGIPRLAWYDEPLHLLGKVRRAREISKSTMWTVFRFQRSELSLMALWASLAYMFENVAPFGMFKLLDYLATPDDMVYKPWIWLTLTFLGPLSRTFFFQQYIFTSTRLIVRVKSGMTQELYHKALESMEIEEDPFEAGATGAKPNSKKDTSHKTTSAGRLATLMAADVDTIFRARDAVMVSFGVTSGTVISLFGLYKMLGWASLVGTAILICATQLSLLIARQMYFEQRKVRRAQDSRISLVTEYLASIRAIKYFGWEDPITDKIVASRAREQKQQWRVSLWQALMGQVTQIFPYISLLVMFGLHVGVEKKRLDA